MRSKSKVTIVSKAAIYAKSAIADRGTINARLDNCKKYATQENMEIDPSHIYSDNGASGNGQLPALTALLAAAGAKPRPFDVVLVDESAHLSRSIVKWVKVVESLTTAGVAVIFVSDQMDSRDPNFRTFMGLSTGA